MRKKVKKKKKKSKLWRFNDCQWKRGREERRKRKEKVKEIEKINAKKHRIQYNENRSFSVNNINEKELRFKS